MITGLLNTRITIRHFTTTKDSFGQEVKTWSDFTSVWANVRVLNGLESIKAGAETSTTKASARIRFRTDITPNMRVQTGGMEWEIKAVLPDLNGRVHVDLSLEAAQ